MPRSPHQITRALLAVTFSLAAALLTTSCTQSETQARASFENGQAAEISKDLKDAEKHYLACISAALESKSPYYHLAALNRLTELERNSNKLSKSKSYMNQAATLAEHDADEDKHQADSIAFAKERHIALMRLANWQFEDGNFVSARKLYEKAVTVEAQLKIDPQLETSAQARITALDSLANAEHDQLSERIATNRYSTQLRGPQAAERALQRRKVINDMQAKLGEFEKQGGKALAKQILDLLAQTRVSFGNRENEYRSWMKYVANSLVSRGEYDILEPVIVEDMRAFTDYSAPQLNAAVPEAVENATFYTQDLLFLARIQQYQSRWKEMLDTCQKAQKSASMVIAKGSEDDYNLTLLTAIAQESNQQRVQAIPNRKRVLEMCKKKPSNMFAYAEYLATYGEDLSAAKRYAEAEAAFEESFKIKRTLRDKGGLSHHLRMYADMLNRQSKTEQARKIALEALSYCMREHDRFALINCYIQLYSICKDINPKEALEYNSRAREAMNKYGTFGQGYLMMNAFIDGADIELRMGKQKDAIKTLDQGVAWQIEHGQKLSAYTAAMLNLKGSILASLGDFQRENETRLQAVDICRRLNPPEPGPLTSTLFQTAERLQERGKYAEAEKLYKEAIQTINNNDPKSYVALLLMCKAGLGATLVISGKDAAQGERLKAEILPLYKSAFVNKPDADIAVCTALSELCFALKDKKNCQLVLNEAEAIFSKDKVNARVMLANLERQKQKLKSIR